MPNPAPTEALAPRPGWSLHGQTWKLRDGPFVARVSPWGVSVTVQFAEWTCILGHSLPLDGTLVERQERCEAAIASMRRQLERAETADPDGAVVGAQVTVREKR